MNGHNIQAPSFGLAAAGLPRFDSLEDLDETMLTGALFGDLNGRGGGAPYLGAARSGYPAAPEPPAYGSGPPGYGAGQFGEYPGEQGQGQGGGPYGGPVGRSWDHPHESHAAPLSRPVPQLPPAQPGLVPHHGAPGSAAARGFSNLEAQESSAAPPTLKRGRQATPRAAAAAAHKRGAAHAASPAAAAAPSRSGGACVDRRELAAPLPGGALPKAKRAARVKKTPEQQRADRRERNRRHARCSRARKKLLIDALQNCIKGLQSENRTLKGHATERFGPARYAELYQQHDAAVGGQAPQMSSIEDLLAEPGTDGHAKASAGGTSTVLEDPDFAFVRALQQGKQNFVITDPHTVDNPIVYATQGFLDLTGYTLNQVLGRNCRFIQGPETDVAEVAKMRKAIAEGVDISVLLLNYRKDGTTFWNQVHCAALRNQFGEIVNYVGVQCEVAPDVATAKAPTGGFGAGRSFDEDEEDDDEEDEDDE